MTPQEITERAALCMMAQMTEAEKAAVFRAKRDLEARMRKHGNLAVFALSLLAVEIQAGKRPHDLVVEAELDYSKIQEQRAAELSAIDPNYLIPKHLGSMDAADYALLLKAARHVMSLETEKPAEPAP